MLSGELFSTISCSIFEIDTDSVGADSIATSNASFDGILCGGCTNTSGCFVSGVVLLLFVPVLLLLIIALPLILTFVFGNYFY